jgi:hypothetical protein
MGEAGSSVLTESEIKVVSLPPLAIMLGSRTVANFLADR